MNGRRRRECVLQQSCKVVYVEGLHAVLRMESGSSDGGSNG
jgi:hypothetical protein